MERPLISATSLLYFYLIIIMSTALLYNDRLIFVPIYQTVFAVNPSAPHPRKLSFQWLWLSSAIKRCSLNFFQQGIYLSKRLPVLLFPLKIFLPGNF